MKQFTKKSFLAGAKFSLKGNVFRFTERWLYSMVRCEVYEVYECQPLPASFRCVHLFLGEIMTKEIQYSDCTLLENED